MRRHHFPFILKAALLFSVAMLVSAAALPPSHDDFDTPRVIGSIPYSDLDVDTSASTSAADDPIVSACNSNKGEASVWYSYTAPANGDLHLDTFGSNYDTLLAIWTGSRGSLNPIACNDDAHGTNQSVVDLSVSAGTTYYFEIIQYTQPPSSLQEKAGGGMLNFRVKFSSMISDYDGDGTTDVAVFRPSNGVWYVKDQFGVQWGANGDIPVAADYNGDGLSDLAVFRPSNGVWYVRDQFGVQFGMDGDIPAPGDYDGDGDTDVAVFRPSNGVWYVKDQFGVQFGAPGDIPVPGDYDGDGAMDAAVFRPSNGVWYVKDQFGVQFGTNGDIPVAGDYNGDGLIDVAVFRPSNGVWYVKDQFGVQFGADGDIPVPGDYDGDGDIDAALFRPSTSVWYVKDQFGTQFGADGDFPLPSRDTDGDGDPYQ